MARIEEEDDSADDEIGVGDLPDTYIDVENLQRRNEAFLQIPVPSDDSDTSRRNDPELDALETSERNISEF